MVRSVAIVGAGVSGLASIKCCLDEGLEPTCFEKSDDIGGLWQFTENPQKGRTGVYRSVMTNTSKEMTCFSDFPFPEDCPNYLHHSVLLEYLRAYAEHFHLLDHIHFKTAVCSIRKHPHFTATGQWVVYTEVNGQQASAIFDAVMVCSGRYAELNLPLDSFPGIENFKGHYLHSWEYRDQRRSEGKNVLVVGAGNTGGDIAAEVSHTAAKVFLSTRRGTWVLSRLSEAGWPVDMVLTTRFKGFMEKFLPAGIMNKIRAKLFNRWFNHENYGLIPIKRSAIVTVAIAMCCQLLGWGPGSNEAAGSSLGNKSIKARQITEAGWQKKGLTT
ncbi:dimethylaniline monooxygenase [N-oxide-forming] 2-like isoform X3 [Rhineura floridana]|uniref:dimethylaniline monooxygenase [N-oxide-forming] 2-like isoform X3 n=1 Tax=Rhineura floridana TaxID=261503 RepID=UPI002AC86242|nr:dimethylaniline monooxygenase [N-oxide-forming] 2-like isoform X3 [Rhineura floridana]XP_061441123.1 dimethylaniline monooxygenase [N-oxide-forming] 2-like isoform X3 [Rhineura floridana]